MMSDSYKTERLPAAMTSPGNAAPPRQPQSIRRTSHIDMHLDTGGARAAKLVADHALVLAGAARDLVTAESGDVVVGAATVTAALDHQGLLATLDVDGAQPGVTAAPLIGRPVSAGFRDAVRAAFADDVRRGSSLALLLDELPVAALISGYARLHHGMIPPDRAGQAMKSDICSGWRSEGTMMTSIHAGSGVPVTIGPRAPAVESESHDDPNGWHRIGKLPVGSMRRRRMLDVHEGSAAWNITAMFRDTYVEPDGVETILHEYALTATVDPVSHVFTSCAAVPRVLPWVECPVAAASADRLVGHHVGDVREFVRVSLRGTSTCTHLNDLLRSLGDVGSLASALRQTLDTAPAPS